ncbi:hypothetical protein Taro_049364 [Colocasia esculenta]|uniref:GST N-terminal domain-containing protein n=1 Tax=Colocasia esculenta TaxID=4460 RepID=A0A843XAR6_COLES|nr:hypothetical protein [Colocasia esculenta]
MTVDKAAFAPRQPFLSRFHKIVLVWDYLRLLRESTRMRNPMAQAEELKFYGLWASPLCMTVEVALKLKGVNYEYIQEDLANKSEDLLRHNPMHRKVPVLVHKGKPLAETLIIAQYIDGTWEEPPLLPEDPYERAMVCFWVDFLYKEGKSGRVGLGFQECEGRLPGRRGVPGVFDPLLLEEVKAHIVQVKDEEGASLFLLFDWSLLLMFVRLATTEGQKGAVVSCQEAGGVHMVTMAVLNEFREQASENDLLLLSMEWFEEGDTKYICLCIGETSRQWRDDYTVEC